MTAAAGSMVRRSHAPAADDPLRLGEWLVCRRLVSRHQLLLALKRSYRKRCRLGDAVVELRLLGRARVEAEVLALTSFNSLLRLHEPLSSASC